MKNFDELDEELVALMPNTAPEADTISEDFADIVFSFRMRRGLTQQQLAVKAGVDVAMIHRIEGGSSGITDSMYEKVFGALAINLGEVIAFIAERESEKEFRKNESLTAPESETRS